MVAEAPADESVSFTLRNGSVKSIKLKIPGVMNPNLSPMSNSGVRLDIGQEIYFYMGSKKKLLLTVTEDFQGQTILVNKLIKEREKEIKAAKEAKKQS